MLDDNRESADKVMILENRYRKDRRFSIIKKVKSKQEQDLSRSTFEHRERSDIVEMPLNRLILMNMTKQHRAFR